LSSYGRDFEYASKGYRENLWWNFGMIDLPEPGTYVHYKNGKHYKVIDVVRHSETEEWMVLYRAEYGDFGLWVRPLTMFMETVEVDGQQIRRFRPV